MFEDFETWIRIRRLRTAGIRYSPSTEASMRAHLIGVTRLAHVTSGEALAAVLGDRVLLRNLLDQCFDAYAPGTVCLIVGTLRRFGEYACERQLISAVAFEAHDAPRRTRVRPIVLYTADELDALLRAARELRDRRYWMFLATMIETGRRVHEILNLRFDDLNLDGQPPHFRVMAAKSARTQHVPLTRRLREEVWTRDNVEQMKYEGDPRIRPRAMTMPFPWRYVTVREKLRRLCKATDVPYRSYHALRHTKATSMLGRGVPIAAVSAFLGHTSIATTDRIYNHANALTFAAYVDA
jgi:integrase